MSGADRQIHYYNMERQRKDNNIGCWVAILLLLAIWLIYKFSAVAINFIAENTQFIIFISMLSSILLGAIFVTGIVLSLLNKARRSKYAKYKHARDSIIANIDVLKLTRTQIIVEKEQKHAENEYVRNLTITKMDELQLTRSRIMEEEKRVQALKLSDIDYMEGSDFEYYTGKLLTHRGFEVEVTPSTNDLGVDIIAQKGDLNYAIQVKRKSSPVSRRAVSDAVAGMSHYQCNAAMVVTNNYFSNGAKKLAQSTGCTLINRDALVDWILEFQAPKNILGSAEINRLDTEINNELARLAEMDLIRELRDPKNILESAEIKELDTEINNELNRLIELEEIYGYHKSSKVSSVKQHKDNETIPNAKTNSPFTTSQRIILITLGLISISIFGGFVGLIFYWMVNR